MTGRNERDRICLIVNPKSAGGATARRVSAIRDAAARHFVHWEVRETKAAGHASDLAAAAATEGFTVIAAVGGDGTANEVINGMMNGEKARGSSAFTIIPAGTGSDLTKSLKIPTGLDNALQTIARAEDRASDLMIVEVDRDGTRHTRVCVNVAGFGMNGDVVARANQSNKRLGGTLTFFGATIRTLLSYQAPLVDVRWVDESGTSRSWEGGLFGAFIANGHYCGGGMYMGRGGSMQDGLAEMTLIPQLGAGRILRGMPRMYDGSLRDLDGIVFSRVREVEAHVLKASDSVRVDVDGEQPGILPVKIRVLPGALVIRGTW